MTIVFTSASTSDTTYFDKFEEVRHALSRLAMHGRAEDQTEWERLQDELWNVGVVITDEEEEEICQE